MLSKNKLKYLRSLALKKHRDEEGVFVAEGRKTVDELIGKMECRMLIATEEYLTAHPQIGGKAFGAKQPLEIIMVDERELSQASSLKTPRDVIAVFATPGEWPLEDLLAIPQRELCLALDTIQDPGNLGTIIRIADWFGIEHIFCSPDTADAYSPKTTQATMGAISRVNIHYLSLPDFLKNLPKELPIYDTFLEGDNIHEKALSKEGLIIMGNEGKGISAEVAACVNEKLFIPPYPLHRATSESLNVAVATAITCAAFRRVHATTSGE